MPPQQQPEENQEKNQTSLHNVVVWLLAVNTCVPLNYKDRRMMQASGKAVHTINSFLDSWRTKSDSITILSIYMLSIKSACFMGVTKASSYESIRLDRVSL